MSAPTSNSGPTKLGRFQMPQVGDNLEGRYEITRMLATGGMGVILQARHLRMGRDVAIKILHPHIAQEDQVVARFEREVRLAQMLNHPNTIRLYDFGEAENGLVYVVMELLDGADLKEIIAEEGPLSVGRAVDLTLQMLDGLGEAHEQDFVHRDLKPSNIFVVEDRRGKDEVKLLDFGIAKSLEEGDGDLTATGSICGTAAYVAPEYLHDPTPTKAADVYAVGLILLEMLTARRAFHGTTTAQTLMMQLQREIQVPRQLAATPLGEIIARSVCKDPAGRYQTADEMFKALEAVVGRLPENLRLESGQVGEILRPPSGTFPGTGHPGTGHPVPAGPSHVQDSSSNLPQAGHTPLSGEHSSPNLEAMDGEATLVTPFPAPLESSRNLPLRAPDYSGAAGESAKGGFGAKKRAVAALVAGVVILGAVVASVALMGDSEGDGTEAVATTTSDGLAEPTGDDPSRAEGPAPADSDEIMDEADDEAAANEPTEEPPAKDLAFHIETLPSKATVFDGDQELGQTPLRHTFARDTLPRTLRIEKDGFEETSLDLSEESDLAQQVMLLEKPEPVVEKPAPAPRPRPSRTRRPRTSGQENQPKEGEENVDEFLDEYL